MLNYVPLSPIAPSPPSSFSMSFPAVVVQIVFVSNYFSFGLASLCRFMANESEKKKSRPHFCKKGCPLQFVVNKGKCK